MQIDSQANTAPDGVSRRYSVLLLLILAAGLFFVLRPSIHGNDGVQNYAYLRSLMFDHDLNFTNEYYHYMQQEARWFNHQELRKDPVTGLPVNLYGVGNAILWSPWVMAAHGCGKIAQTVGADLRLDGYGPLYILAVSAGSCFYGSISLWLTYRLLRRFGASAANSFWSVMLLLLASPLFFYLYLHPSMSHANSLFLTSVVLTLYFRNGETRTWLLLGLAAGMLVITRFQDAVLLIPIAAAEVVAFLRQPERSLRQCLPRYAAGLSTFLLCLVPQLAAWHVLQGSAFSGPRGYLSHGTITPWEPQFAANALFSARHGLFYWHPALLLAVAGLLLPGPWQRQRLMALAALALQAWIIGSWSIWWAGASFGHRLFISTLPYLAIGVCYLQQSAGPLVRALIRGTILVFALWNFGCIVQYGLGWIDRQGPVSWSTLSYNNFVRIPSLLLK